MQYYVKIHFLKNLFHYVTSTPGKYDGQMTSIQTFLLISEPYQRFPISVWAYFALFIIKQLWK